MSDTQAKAQSIVDKFKMDTRHSNYTVIEGDDADNLVLDIAAALNAREREVWREAAKQCEKGVFVWRGMNNGKADALHEFADWCRRQGGEGGEG